MKRLAASVTVAGRENGFDAERRAAIVRQVVGKYRRPIRKFATMKTLDVWYARASVGDLQERFRYGDLARCCGSNRRTLTWDELNTGI